ncbi:MAG: histidine kinase [Saprospiraceae bacterium]|nr:histidine kinase [Saprospiraceae bacterium]
MIKQLPIPYIVCIIIGIVLGLILGTKWYLAFLYWGELEKFSWVRYFFPQFINNTLWGFLVPVVYYFMQKFSLGKASTRGEKMKAIGASLALAAFHESFSYVLWFLPADWFGWFRFNLKEFDYIIGAFPTGFISRVVEYWIIYGILSAMDYAKKYRLKQLELVQMESQLANAQLSALRLQLQPHFLFNTLNTISSLMDINIKDAQKMVSRLGNLLRAVLDKNKRARVSLREELEFTDNYLSIERMRFMDRLSLIYDVDDSLMDAEVPSLILQPLVENAVKHGLSQKTDPGTITITARRKESGTMEIEVKDDGVGSDQSNQLLLKGGIGLRNVEERLNLIYKGEANMDIVSVADEGFKVVLTLPVKTFEL